MIKDSETKRNSRLSNAMAYVAGVTTSASSTSAWVTSAGSKPSPATPTCARSSLNAQIPPLFTVHNGVGHLCKTAPNLCTEWGNTEDSIGMLFLYGTLTWENAVRALCIDGEPELSTRHAATANK